MKKRTEIDAIALYHANLAVLAEREDNFEDAGKLWRKASEASLKPDATLLYKEASMRCERRARMPAGERRS